MTTEITKTSCDFTFRGFPDPEDRPRWMNPILVLPIPAKSQTVLIDLVKYKSYLEFCPSNS